MTYYGTTTEFIAYAEERGKELDCSIGTDDMEQALLVASEWVDNVYGKSFSGYKTGGFVQEREWPRATAVTNTYPQHVFADSDIPDRVKQATYEAALRQIATPGSLQVDYTPNKYKRVSIDGALSVEYAGFSSASEIQSQFLIIDQLLAPLFCADAPANFSSLTGGVSRV